MPMPVIPVAVVQPRLAIPPLAREPGAGPLADTRGRGLRDLRISVTDRCNLRCVYCMPEDMTFRPRAELLQDDELVRLVHLCAGLGFLGVTLDDAANAGDAPLISRPDSRVIASLSSASTGCERRTSSPSARASVSPP